MICASIGAATNDEAIASLRTAKQSGADLAELRLDLIRDPDPERLLKDRPLPVVATARPAWEGGRFEGNEADRIGLLEQACLYGAEWVDVEFRAFKDFKRRDAKLILSFHDFEKTPGDLDRTVRKMRGLEPDLLKVAVTAEGTADVLRLVRMQKESGIPSAFIPMGPWGEPVRILYRKFGGFLTYAPLSLEASTAPGQIPLGALVKDFRVKSFDDDTKFYGVAGNPVAHTRSPALFNAAFRQLGLAACYVRLPLDDGALLREMLDVLEIEGASVTLPHKEAAVSQVDRVEEQAKAIGAVNTIARGEGGLTGTNTDVLGFLEAIRDGAIKKWSHGVYGLRALVLGAGGVARALAWGLKTEGAQVTIASRTWDRARLLAEALGCNASPIDQIARVRPQILVNATPVGMAPKENEMPPVEELLVKDLLVFDSVYTPRDTKLLREARGKGAATVDGVELFLRQADHQFQAWFGRKIPREVVKEFRRSPES